MTSKNTISDYLIDLRSDTVTKPTSAMLNAIMHSSSGDHGYYEDEITLELENFCAVLFKKQAALFMPSGTMSNQIAIRCWTQPGDEIILDQSYHINYFEAGPTTDLGKVYLNLTSSKDGIMRPKHIKQALNNKSRSEISNEAKLICLENTINTFGGKIYPIYELKKIFEFSNQHNLFIHLDGARLLNACAASGILPSEYSQYVDSLTICFSKGLGAPYGSILMGSHEFIRKAKKYCKWYGGGLHQSGYMAAAALYAITHNQNQLQHDNENAKLLAKLLSKNDYYSVYPKNVETNIVMLHLNKLGLTSDYFLNIVKNYNILLYPWSKYTVRAVTHLGISKENIHETAYCLDNIAANINRNNIHTYKRNYLIKKGRNNEIHIYNS